ncbi:MAG: hypothetical protein ACE5J9_01570 [Methanosarcinales archaeon]
MVIDNYPGLEEETLRPDELDYLGTAVTLEIAKKNESYYEIYIQ